MSSRISIALNNTLLFLVFIILFHCLLIHLSPKPRDRFFADHPEPEFTEEFFTEESEEVAEFENVADAPSRPPDPYLSERNRRQYPADVLDYVYGSSENQWW